MPACPYAQLHASHYPLRHYPFAHMPHSTCGSDLIFLYSKPAGTTRTRRSTSSRSTAWRPAPLVSILHGIWLQGCLRTPAWCAALPGLAGNWPVVLRSTYRPGLCRIVFAGFQPCPLCEMHASPPPIYNSCPSCPSPTGVLVDDAAEAYRASTANGGIGVRAPVTLKDEATGQVGPMCAA